MRRGGFTLVEVLLAGVVLIIAVAAILAGYVSQVTLNEHSRNLSLAMNDATRMIEQIRQQNSSCPGGVPSAAVTGGPNTWLASNGGKSVWPTQPALEHVRITTAGANPLTVRVVVCWRHRNRTLGECEWNGAAFVDTDSEGPDGDGDGILESPAMLTTLVTCR
jgi:type II secretory pathway pseudopilin PulG